MIRKGDLLTSIDIKQAFQHIKIAPNSTASLQFQANGNTFEFQTLPFGVSTAPSIWCSLLGEIIKTTRKEGIRISFYMDDILIAASSHQESITHTQRVLAHLQAAGIQINWEKSQLSPSHKIRHIGFLWNSKKNLILLPEDKLKDIRKQSRLLLSNPFPTPRQLARVIGKIISTSPAFSPAIFKRRPLHKDLAQALQQTNNDWDLPGSTLSPASIKALRFFSSSKLTKKFNGQILTLQAPSLIITTDASPSGWGATLFDPSRDLTLTTRGQWSRTEKDFTSNQKETQALSLATFAFKNTILNHPDRKQMLIHFKTDNITALSYLQKMGGPLPHLNELIHPLISFLHRHTISFSASHIPGPENTTADKLSRCKKRDHDYHLHKSTFEKINETLGPLNFDLFASRTNTQLSKFASWNQDPTATFRDAFSLTWKTGSYAFPPIPTIPRVLNHLINCTHLSSTTLVIPNWPRAIWWPTLLEVIDHSKPILRIPADQVVIGSHPSSAFRHRSFPNLIAASVSNRKFLNRQDSSS
ncbi:MAG: reverse transcriptase domain-containing protein [Candidatus Paceibacterota bacterium]